MQRMGLNELVTSSSNRTSVPLSQDTGELRFITNRRDAMYIVRTHDINEQLLLEMDFEHIARNCAISDKSRAEISVHRKEYQKRNDESEKALTRKTKTPPPAFNAKEIFEWSKKFEQWLDTESLSEFWYRNLIGSCSIQDHETLVHAVQNHRLDPDETFRESCEIN